MGKAKSAADTLRLGSERSYGKGSDIVNRDFVHKPLQPSVQRNYARMMKFWAEYQKQNPRESPHDLKSLKDFIRKFAYSIDGAEGISVPGSETVRKQWNAFTAAWQREYPDQRIPRSTAASITQFINGPLAGEMGMPKTKRPRRFATKTVILNFARQLWAADWVEHKHPATPVDDWALLLGNTYSSSRIGEYIESTCRSGTGRGLCFKDLVFVAFINEERRPEFAIQLTRDAKNMTGTPDKRPQHALYEGLAPGPLCFNPMLPFLARLLAYEAFQNYHRIEDLLRIVPPEDEMMVIEWRKELLDTPFFRSQSSDEIETAAVFSRRLRMLGLRAGYATPPRNHDIRAEGLYLMNQFESEATRMVYAGHTDPNTVARHYLPRNGADGQAAYHNQERRTLVLDLFRGLTIPRNPRLWQCLPAKEQFGFENSPEILRLNRELIALRNNTSSKSLQERKQLYAERRRLSFTRLREWQKHQPVKHDDPPGYYRAIFDRVRFLIPERDRLAQNMFEVDTLRSPTGLAVIQDMLSLYQKRSNVEFRPGLEPDKCQCKSSNSYEWRHVYECHKEATANVCGFSELCFLCSKWFYETTAWEQHCQYHLDHPMSLPTWCDPLMYGGVLATAGYCPFCLENRQLPASVRMYQFKRRGTWHKHIQLHIQTLQNGPTPVHCPRLHEHCPREFDSVLELQFHLQDAFGIECVGHGTKMKRPAYTDDDISPPKKKTVRRRDSGSGENNTMGSPSQWVILNFSADSVGISRLASPDPSQEAVFGRGLDTAVVDDAMSSSYNTPLSSVSSEEEIDPAIFLDRPLPNNHTFEADPGTSYKRNAALRDSFMFSSTTPEKDEIISESLTEAYVSFHRPSESLGAAIADTKCDSIEAGNTTSMSETDHDRAVSLGQENGQFEVEQLVAKGRIGRRVWYKVKWKGYPESENSWVRRKDIGSGSLAIYEAANPHGHGEFKFERLVSKREADGMVLYEAKWQGQPDSNNIWVNKWDAGGKAVAVFEATSTE